jgi:hypothetical protein
MMCPSALRARELLLEPWIPVRSKSLISVPEGFDDFRIKACRVEEPVVLKNSDFLPVQVAASK